MNDTKRPRPSFELPNPNQWTVVEYREILSLLHEQCERIRALSRRYPIYLTISGTAYRFDSPEDVDRFIEKLESAIRHYEHPTPSHPSPVASAV
jgi:hypothetical protein